MSYDYDDKTGEVVRVPLPKLTEEEVQIMENTPAPVEFLNKIRNMRIVTSGTQLTINDFCTDTIDCKGTLNDPND